jgi:hypothetical protein
MRKQTICRSTAEPITILYARHIRCDDKMDGIQALALGTCICAIMLSGCLEQAQESQPVVGAQGVPQGGAPGGPQGNRGQMGQRNMPQEAVNACAGSAENDTCDYSASGREVNGTCRSGRGGQLACMPQFRGLPPQMIDACAQKEANATCEFQMNDTTVKGLCRSRGGQMGCIPEGTGQTLWRRNMGTGGEAQPENQGNNPPERPQTT